MNFRKSFWLFKSAIDILKDKGAPEWLHNHPKIKNKKAPNKIFPSIGLSNFREPVKLNFENPDFKSEKQYLMSSILKAMLEGFESAESHFNKLSLAKQKGIKDMSPDSEEYLSTKSEIVNLDEGRQACLNMVMAMQYCINQKSDTMPDTVKLLNKNIANKGQKVFGAYTSARNKILELWNKYTKNKIWFFNPLEDMGAFEHFSSFNFTDKEYFVVFSADGDTGSWDISTMSERGISSCQSWKEGERNVCLVGSVLSKYIGVIYLTSQSSTARGEKMNRRCLVRYGIRDGKPLIILDKMYDRDHVLVREAFISALKKRTSLPVVYFSDLTHSPLEEMDIEIPFDEEVADLEAEKLPYMDLPLKIKTPFKENVFDLLEREDLPIDIQQRIYRENKNNKEILLKFLKLKELSLDVFEDLCQSPYEEIRVASAGHDNISFSASSQDLLSQDPVEKVRLALLENPHTYKDVVKRMLNDSSLKVRQLAQEKLKDVKDFAVIPDDE